MDDDDDHVAWVTDHPQKDGRSGSNHRTRPDPFVADDATGKSDPTWIRVAEKRGRNRPGSRGVRRCANGWLFETDESTLLARGLLAIYLPWRRRGPPVIRASLGGG